MRKKKSIIGIVVFVSVLLLYLYVKRKLEVLAIMTPGTQEVEESIKNTGDLLPIEEAELKKAEAEAHTVIPLSTTEENEDPLSTYAELLKDSGAYYEFDSLSYQISALFEKIDKTKYPNFFDAEGQFKIQEFAKRYLKKIHKNFSSEEWEELRRLNEDSQLKAFNTKNSDPRDSDVDQQFLDFARETDLAHLSHERASLLEELDENTQHSHNSMDARTHLSELYSLYRGKRKKTKSFKMEKIQQDSLLYLAFKTQGMSDSELHELIEKIKSPIKQKELTLRQESVTEVFKAMMDAHR